MSVKDDYPAITILADACADKEDDSVPEAVRAWREVARLRQWKAEADEVLAAWEGVWMIAGQPWRRGETQPQAVAREVQRLRSEVDAWMNGVADVVEPLGHDRHAASGPADLLPGLTTLAERLRECVEARRYLYEQVVEITSGGARPVRRERYDGRGWYENPAHHRPEPSQRSLELVGKIVTYQGSRAPHGPIDCKVTAAEKVFSTITLGHDGSMWSAVRFRLKPINGKRAFWTPSMPDEPLGERVSEVDTSDRGQVT